MKHLSTLLFSNNINRQMFLDEIAKCISSDFFFCPELNLWSLKSTHLKCLSMSNNSLSSVMCDFSV